MRYHLIIWLSLLSLPGLGYCSDENTNTVSNTNSILSSEKEPYDVWKEHKIITAEQVEQDAYIAKEVEIQSRIDSLQNDVATQLVDAKSSHEAVESSRSLFLYTKSKVRDPWREIYSETKFVLSAGSSFVQFSGQIQEVADNGIRVFGQIGDSAKAEYFVVNFPYHFKAGESVDPTRIYVALEDGTFSYISEDGYAKSLPKLNYGKPCARPSNSDDIEQSALQSQLSTPEQNAKDKDESATATEKLLQEANDEIGAVQKEAAEKMRLAKDKALKYDLAYANKGNIDALRRMEARYRDGDAVEADTNKAAEYHKKYEDSFQTEADRIAEKNRLIEQEALRQKFLRNLDLADKRDNVESALYVEKCYRYGLGTEKDLSKAEEYHSKAVSSGLPQHPNTRF